MVAITCVRKWASSQVWQHAFKLPILCVKDWLKSAAGVVPMDVHSPCVKEWEGVGETVSVRARVDSSVLPDVLKASGNDAIFAMLLLPRDEDGNLPPSESRPVWLNSIQIDSIPDALRQAARLPYSEGLGFNRKGQLGVIVPNNRFQQAAAAILGTAEAERLSADAYLVTGVPSSWSQKAITETLKHIHWECHVDERHFSTCAHVPELGL